MDMAKFRRVLRRVRQRVLQEIVDAGAVDPKTAMLVGALTEREAIDSGRVTIGPHTYGSFKIGVDRNDRMRIGIGAYCSIASGVEFGAGGDHRVDWVSTYPFRIRWNLPGAYEDGHPRSQPDIIVGNDVWIGSDALIFPGVTIGDGAVIGARAVVTRPVRPYAVMVGVPAREVRRRFSDEQVDALLKLRWWDWPQERVRAHVDLLNSPDVDALLALSLSLSLPIERPGTADY
jgi:acetyltransferase-like isoleucine patch superfamily enzyme